MSGLLRRALGGLSLCLILSSGTVAAIPDSTPSSPAAASVPQVAGASATVTVDSSILHRLADLEAYVNNTARVNDDDSRVRGPGPGHNTWLMVSAALVLFMTLPGLTLFFGGLVRSKNVLAILAQCMGITGVVTLLWWAVGYSLAYSPGNGFIGGLHWAFFRGVGAEPNTTYSPWVSHNVFAMFQLMFAIITPALLVGAAAERITFRAMTLISVLWLFLVYIPIAHMAWSADGIFNGVWNAAAPIKALDFAGGFAVEMASGWSALALVWLLGPRKGFGKDVMPPHSMVLAMTGAGLLWVGWYGFNVGSAMGSDGVASNAFVATTLAAAAASLLWPGLEWLIHGKPTVLGFCSGIVAGLVAITPGAGFVSSGSAVLIALLATGLSFFMSMRVKHWLKYDDALDTFGVHGVAGTVGTLLTAVFASVAINPNLRTNLGDVLGWKLVAGQATAMAIVVAVSVLGTLVAVALTKWILGLRPALEEEINGLDYADHGERGWHLEEN